MSQRVANCPNCGALVNFRWSAAVQTTCEYCKSILVRHDVNLDKVGVVADLPLDSSPIQIGTEGIHRNKAFVVVGRIIYEYEQGNWNEWHLIFSDGTSGWLSDAMLDYTVTYLAKPPAPLAAAHLITKDSIFQWDTLYYAGVKTMARYRGVEGELPFEYWDKESVLFVDLRTADERFGTIDYSDDPPLLFLGEYVQFNDLKLKNVRYFEGWPQ
jgi:hypothetical protein